MKKNIIQSTFYLILVSVVAKALSFLVRILLARELLGDAMNLYSLAAPTMVILITLAQMGIPAALSKVIAQKQRAAQPLKTSILLSLATNLLVMLAYCLFLPILAKQILKQDMIQPVLWAIVPLIPLVSLSGILKGYLFGIQRHLSATAAQLFEEGTRIIFLLIIFRMYPHLGVTDMARIAMLSVSVGEAGSCLFMLCMLRKKTSGHLQLQRLFTNLHRSSFDEVLAISIPMTGSRLIGSFTYFLEPIIMVMGLSALSAAGMVNAYGQLNGYVLPILTMPSFVTVTLSNFLLPSFTYHHARGNHKTAGKLFTIIIGTCFLIGFTCSFLCFYFAQDLLMLFYHNATGAHLLRSLAWPFAFYSLQPPLSSMLHALSYSRRAMWDTCLGSLCRLLCVAFLTMLVGEASLAIGLTLGMMLTTLLHAFNVTYALHHPKAEKQ